MPEISVIIPIFNAGRFLSRCLDSLLAQTLDNFEIICIDDGSTDNSRHILSEYCRRDKRIRVFTRPNQGVSAARNTGLEHVCGNFVIFIDADDYVHPQLLSCLYTQIYREKADISSCLIMKGYSEKTVSWQSVTEGKIAVDRFENPLAAFMKKRIVRTESYARLYKKEILDGIRFMPGVRYEDVLFTTQVMWRAKLLVIVKKSLYVYSQHPASFMHQKFTKDKAADYIKIMRHVYRFAELNCPENLADIRRYITNHRFKMMVNQLVRKQKDTAVQNDIFEFIQREIRALFTEGVISYDGLKLKHKIRLFLLLNCRDATLCRLWANLI